MASNYLRTALLGVSILAISTSAQAASPYIEGQAGITMINDVETDTYSGSSGGVTWTNVKGEIDYDNAFTLGAEIGVSDFGVNNLRLGVGAKRLEAKLSSVELSGTATDGTTTLTGPGKFSRDDVNSIGADLDNTIALYSVNAYYDFDVHEKFTPFVGVGIGFADIENAKDLELAGALSIGAQYDFTEKFYAGLRGDYHMIAGPSDELGLDYESIHAFTASATIGYRF